MRNALNQTGVRRGVFVSTEEIARQRLDAARAKLERARDPIDLGALLSRFDRPECSVEVSGKTSNKSF